jgi:hypothetical protein
MQENMDLILAMLVEIDKQPFDEKWRNIAVQRHSREELCYHAHLASDAGFIEVKFFQNSSSEFLVRRLTKAGRAFLDTAREGTSFSLHQ